MSKGRLGPKERLARKLEKQRAAVERQARRLTCDKSNDVLAIGFDINDKGQIVQSRTVKTWSRSGKLIPSRVALENSNSMLDHERLKSGTHHTTAFRAGVSNLSDGRNITYGKAKITLHVPGQVVSAKAKAAVKRNMQRSLGTVQRFSIGTSKDAYNEKYERPTNPSDDVLVVTKWDEIPAQWVPFKGDVQKAIAKGLIIRRRPDGTWIIRLPARLVPRGIIAGTGKRK